MLKKLTNVCKNVFINEYSYYKQYDGLSKTYLPSVSTWIHFTINFNITISVKMNVEPNGQPIHIFQLFTNDPYLTN